MVSRLHKVNAGVSAVLINVTFSCKQKGSRLFIGTTERYKEPFHIYRKKIQSRCLTVPAFNVYYKVTLSKESLTHRVI